jgi:peroxiredoxin 2/4
MTEIFVGNEAPNFIAKAVMPDNSFDDNFDLKSYAAGNKLVVFFYPLDFTFVCPSEIIAFDNRLGEFTSRKTKVVGISVDSHFSHLAFKNTAHNKGGIGNIQYPLISDLTKSISKDYRVLTNAGISLRGSFFIDQNFVLRHMIVNDLPLGRSVDEMLRLIDAWDHHTEYGEVCPAGWSKGKEGMTATKEGVADFLSSNAEKL